MSKTNKGSASAVFKTNNPLKYRAFHLGDRCNMKTYYDIFAVEVVHLKSCLVWLGDSSTQIVACELRTKTGHGWGASFATRHGMGITAE